MKLKDIIKLCDGPVNINLYGKGYSTLGHEVYNIYPYPADKTPRMSKDYLAELNKKFADMMKIYKDCAVVGLYGFDDGLTIIIKVEK